MKRLTFTCVLEGDWEGRDDTGRFVRMALTYGDKHQDFTLYPKGDIQVEDMEEDGTDGS